MVNSPEILFAVAGLWQKGTPPERIWLAKAAALMGDASAVLAKYQESLPPKRMLKRGRRKPRPVVAQRQTSWLP